MIGKCEARPVVDIAFNTTTDDTLYGTYILKCITHKWGGRELYISMGVVENLLLEIINK